MPSVERVYQRDELYELVWSKPMREVAEEYGVSNVALKKICRRLEVPTPPPGYWLRVAAGRSGVRPVLAPLRANQPDRIVTYFGEDDEPIEVSPEAVQAAARERDTAKIVASSVLDAPHPLVKHAAELLGRSKLFDACVSSREGGLDITVAPESATRALCIMDALIKALEARSLSVEVVRSSFTKDRGSLTRVVVDGQAIEFALAEVVKISPPSAKPPPPRRDRIRMALPATLTRPVRRRARVPTGRLTLTILGGAQPRCWYDRKRMRLESFLNDFVAHLFVAADWMAQEEAMAAELRRRERQDEIRRENKTRALEAKKKRIEELHQQLKRWRLARDLRAFASDIRGTVV